MPESACGHEHVIGGITYRCERAPHMTGGYGATFRHVAGIDENHARGTDEADGWGTADLVTWGEDEAGDGQDWGIAWGTVADYAADPSPHARGWPDGR